MYDCSYNFSSNLNVLACFLKSWNPTPYAKQRNYGRKEIVRGTWCAVSEEIPGRYHSRMN